MSVDIWKICNGKNHIKKLNKIAWRIIELQENVSIRKLVDSIEEQKILEEMMDTSASSFRSQTDFHPFLFQPFRYPPLQNGSRFGKKIEPALWYGALTPKTAMAEKAYYKHVFIEAMKADPGPLYFSIAVFSVGLNISRGIELDKKPFLKYQNYISSPVVYEPAQFLGQQMRSENIDGFTYISARDTTKGINIAVFKMDSFVSRYPDADSFQTWQCNVAKSNVEFVRMGILEKDVFVFPKRDFMVDGVLPSPCWN